MRVVVFGRPLSGKGTLSRGLAKAKSVPHVDAGQLLREAASGNDEHAKEIKALIEGGNLVDDSLIAGLIIKRLSQRDCRAGFVLDGFPRTVEQVRILREEIEPLVGMIDHYCFLDVPHAVLFERLEKRRKNAKIPREDDKPEVLKKRLKSFAEITAPAIHAAKAHASKQGVPFVFIDARFDAPRVLADTLSAFARYHAAPGVKANTKKPPVFRP
jgi:adenylate kinase